MKKFKLIKIIDVAWVITFIIAALTVLILGNMEAAQICLEKLVEKRDYYVNFLWPNLNGYVVGAAEVLTLASGFIYAESFMDADYKLGSKEEIIVKNVALTAGSITNSLYMLVNMLCLKCFNWSYVLLIPMTICAIVCIAKNCRSYRNTDSDATIDKIWSHGNIRINILLGTIVGCVILFGGLASSAIGTAKEEYITINSERIELCFGHTVNIEDNRGTVKVEFVNMYGASGRQYSMEELEQEYINFKTGLGSWSNLWQFCQDSIDIELNSQIVSGIYERRLYIDSYRTLGGYYFAENDYSDNDVRRNLIYEKLDDIVYFTVCVEEELNIKGLTLRQPNDTAGMGEDAISYIELEYETATCQQVVEACHSFASKNEPIDGNAPLHETVDTIDMSMDVAIGQMVGDITIAESNGYNISKVSWSIYTGGDDEYELIDDREKIESQEAYRVSVYFSLPLSYTIEDNLKVNLSGITYDEVSVDEDYDEINEIKVDIFFTANAAEGFIYKGVPIAMQALAPEEILAECDSRDVSRYSDTEYYAWKTYDIKTGVATDYTEETLSGDYMCYIVIIKITPDDAVSFEDVELVYLGKGLNIYEYDASLHQYKAGEYPKPYFEKHKDDEGEYILAYIPHFMVYTTGVDGDVWNTYTEGNYVYLPEGVAMNFRDRPNLGYEVVNYVVTDFDNNEVEVKGDLLGDRKFTMVSYPVIVTGYFEPEY